MARLARKARREPGWLSEDAVRAIHAEQLERFGGEAGLLHPAGLEAALARPRNRWLHDRGADLADLAATYLVGLMHTHPFVDGNKRVGVAAALVFLAVNHRPLHVPQVDLYSLAMGAATGGLKEAQAAAWLRRSLGPRRK